MTKQKPSAIERWSAIEKIFLCYESRGTGERRKELLAAARKELADYERLLEAANYFSLLKDCDEEPNKCAENSGPCCDTHGDNFLHKKKIAALRLVIAAIREGR